MRKSSKLISLGLAALMSVSSFAGLSAVSASAADTTDTNVYFEVPTLEAWGTTKTVYCHVYSVYGGSPLTETSWQSKSELCKLDKTTGLYAFDTAKLGVIEDGADYALLFSTVDSAKAPHQTANVTFGKECLGDTVYVTGDMVENTEDSSKMDYEATWKNNSEKYGAKAAITSTGKVVGKKFPVYQPRPQLVSQYICSFAVKNVNIEAGKVTPEKLANICATLEVEPMDVYNQYAADYEAELADPEANPMVAPLETVAELLGVDPTPTEEPTEEPTQEPTEEPTQEPTEEPTQEPTEEPTQEPTEEPTTEPVEEEPVYVVAGDEALLGVNWVSKPEEAPENVMTKNGDVYELVIYDVLPSESYQLKVVENLADGTQNWIGDNGTDFNVTFAVEEPGCDVTVTYDPATGLISVTGDTVKFNELVIESIRTVGNGDGAWLNGVGWDPDADENLMTEIADGIYEITYEGVDEFYNYQVKFAANKTGWTTNWGGVYEGSGVESDAVFNGQDNITIDVPYELADVTIRLDLTNFDTKTKEGAKFTVTVTDATPAPDGIFGDVNEDGVVNITDATIIQKMGIGLAEGTEFQMFLADVNGDGRVSILDVTLIQKYAADLGYNTGLVGVPYYAEG